MKESIIAVDLGTTGIKVSIVDFEGNVYDSAYNEYSLITNSSGQAEQNPMDWWDGLVRCIRALHEKIEISKIKVTAISLCGQMHTHVYLDSCGNILGNAITWLDQRSSEIIDNWKKEGIDEALFEETGVYPTTTYTVPQILWTKKNKKELFNKIDKVLIAKDFLKYLLTGNMITDPSDASGTGTFDIRNGKWSDEAFAIIGLKKEFFPEVLPSTSIIGYLSESSSKILGLPSGIPVINGGSDHSISEIGSGMLNEGNASCVIGTAGVFAACSSKPIVDRQKRIICWKYPLEGYWDLLGVTQTAASSLTWFRNSFDPDSGQEIFEEYSNMAANVSLGSEGLIFLPYLMGERTPHWNPEASGVFFGIKITHEKSHFVRAIMEGVAYSLKECSLIMEELGIYPVKISLTGGGSKSEIWQNIVSDVLNKEISIPRINDTSILGNLILSLLALDYLKKPEEAKSLIKSSERILPNSKNVEKYNMLFQIYKEIYMKTKDTMKKLSKM